MTRSIALAVAMVVVATAAGAATSNAVKVAIEPMTPPAEGNVGYFYVTVENTTDRVLPYAELVLQVDTPVLDAVVAGDQDNPWVCAGQAALWVRCGSSNPPFNASLAPRQALRFRFFVRPANYGRFSSSAFVAWRGEDGARMESEPAYRIETLIRTLRVTNSDDAGPGSLRQAIVDVDEGCVPARIPCAIVFDQDVQAIRPLTPLPLIGGQPGFTGSVLDLTIDGTGVTLDGSALSSGSGITVLGYGFLQITGFTVTHFPEYGFDLQFAGLGRGSSLEGNSIAMNGRGIQLSGGTFDVRRNVITGNARSGVFLASGDFALLDNDISSNGASGVYCGPHTGGRLAGNRIAGNREFGVALDATAQTRVDDNVIRDNGLLPIDVGLDGFSGYRFYDAQMAQAVIPPPHLVRAEYDAAAGTTTISGTWVVTDGQTVVYLYANSRPLAQGERFVGKFDVYGGFFTVTVPQDLRGAFIAAYVQHSVVEWSGSYLRTSEFSDQVVQVPPGPRRRAVR